MDATSQHFLMCRPTYFAVDYAINPWMDPSAPVDTDLAIQQWEQLRQAYRDLGHTVEEIAPVPGLPDMVFAANGGTVIDGKAMAVQFRDPQRADEAPAYRAWFEAAGLELHDPKHVNEGEGDILLAGEYLLAGTGFRTAHASHAQLQEVFGYPVITMQLVDPRFYHLDTALAVLDERTVAYLPEAFSPRQPGGAAPALPRRRARHHGRRHGSGPQRGQRWPARSAADAGHRFGGEAAGPGLPDDRG